MVLYFISPWLIGVCAVSKVQLFCMCLVYCSDVCMPRTHIVITAFACSVLFACINDVLVLFFILIHFLFSTVSKDRVGQRESSV